MSVLQAFLIAVVLGALGVIAGILANWLPRPAGVRNRWIVVGLAAAVTATAAVGLWQQGRASGERSLRDWASQVDRACAQSTRSLGEAAHITDQYFRQIGWRDADYLATVEERVRPALSKYAASYDELHVRLGRVDLPSAPSDAELALRWLEALDAYAESLDDATFSVSDVPDDPEEWQRLEMLRVAAEATGARHKLERVNDQLGVSCMP